MNSQNMGNTEVENQIFELIKKQLFDKKIISISNIKPITNGWETKILSFQLHSKTLNQEQSETENLILRVYQNVEDVAKAITEFNIMSFLWSIGYRVPKVLFKDTSMSIFDRPLIVMETIAGHTLGDIFFSSDSDKEKILSRFCQLFLDLHTIHWDKYLGHINSKDFQNVYYFTDNVLNYLKDIINYYHLKELIPYYEWLEKNRNNVSCKEYSLIHLDFHPYNIIVDENDQYFVIDWSNGRIGDYRADLAWTLILTLRDSTYTYYQSIFKIYEALRQEKIEQFSFFEVSMALRRLSDFLISLKYGADKTGMRPEVIDSMKQSLDHYYRIYQLLVDRTGIYTPELENILSYNE